MVKKVVLIIIVAILSGCLVNTDENRPNSNDGLFTVSMDTVSAYNFLAFNITRSAGFDSGDIRGFWKSIFPIPATG